MGNSARVTYLNSGMKDGKQIYQIHHGFIAWIMDNLKCYISPSTKGGSTNSINSKKLNEHCKPNDRLTTQYYTCIIYI